MTVLVPSLTIMLAAHPTVEFAGIHLAGAASVRPAARLDLHVTNGPDPPQPAEAGLAWRAGGRVDGAVVLPARGR